MLNKYLIAVFLAVCLLMRTCAAQQETLTTFPLHMGSCASPSELALRCLGEWACRHAIRLDLRCLLNLNGIPLLGGILGGTGGGGGGGILGGVLGGGGGGKGGGGKGGGGAGGGILGGLLGR